MKVMVLSSVIHRGDKSEKRLQQMLRRNIQHKGGDALNRDFTIVFIFMKSYYSWDTYIMLLLWRKHQGKVKICQKNSTSSKGCWHLISLKNGRQNFYLGSDHALLGRNRGDSFLVSKVPQLSYLKAPLSRTSLFIVLHSVSEMGMDGGILLGPAWLL